MDIKADDDDSDELSATSSQSVIDTMQSEAHRRHARAKSIRSKANRKGRRTRSSSSISSGIMSVRTNEESLATLKDDGNWKKVVDNRRKRRVLQRRVDGVVKDVKDGNFRNDSPLTNSTSEIESLGSNLTNTSIVSTEKFSVRFDSVTVREHPMIAGDNPTITRGPPITIDWVHNHEETYGFEYFEHRRGSQRRLQTQMKMPPEIREDILINSGYSHREIREVVKDATIIRRQRIRTIELMHHDDNFGEKLEGIKRIFGKPFKTKEEKETESKMKIYYQKSKSQLTEKKEVEPGGIREKDKPNGIRKKDKTDLHTKKKRNNSRTIEEAMNESNSSSASVLDSSRSRKQYDLTPQGNNQGSEIDSSKNGRKYDLFPNEDDNGAYDGDAHVASEDVLRDEIDTSKRGGKNYDLLGEAPYEDDEDPDTKGSIFFCFPEGAFLSMFWQQQDQDKNDEIERGTCNTL